MLETVPRVAATLCSRSPPTKRGGHQRRWSFAYADLAALLGVSERRIRTMVNGTKEKAPSLDPRSLEAICFAWARRQGWAQP